MRGNRAQVFLSGGGMDSAAVAVHHGFAASCIPPQFRMSGSITHLAHVSYGQKAEDSELEAVFRQSTWLERKYPDQKFPVLPISMVMPPSNASIMEGSTGSTTERSSNMMHLRNPMLALAVVTHLLSLDYNIINMLVGFHKENDDVFRDARIGWFHGFERMVSNASRCVVTMYAPFSDLTRQEIYAKGRETAGADFDSLIHSCYEHKPCGVCTHCIELQAMKAIYEQGQTQ